MKLLILSDIHSNIYALDAILKAEQKVDKIYAAGDLTDYGPTPCEVIDRFKELNIETVIGNHDKNMIAVWENIKEHPEQLNDTLTWAQYNCLKLSEDRINYLKSLPETLDFTADGYYYRISHQYDSGYGRPQSIYDLKNFLKQKPLERTDLPIRLIFGHSHRQAVCTFREGSFLNSGSVSYRRPDDPDKTAHYAVIENGNITLKSITYDRTPLLKETISLAKSKKLKPDQLQVAFFFFGNAENTETDVEEYIKKETFAEQ